MEFPAHFSKSLFQRKLIALFISILKLNSIWLLSSIHAVLPKLLDQSLIIISTQYDLLLRLVEFMITKHASVLKELKSIRYTFTNNNIIKDLLNFFFKFVFFDIGLRLFNWLNFFLNLFRRAFFDNLLSFYFFNSLHAYIC